MLEAFAMDHVMIWQFSDAPESFRRLSDFVSGKELWLAYVPQMYVKLLKEIPQSVFGGTVVHIFEANKYGALIYIGATD